jgi:hypothetical protein
MDRNEAIAHIAEAAIAGIAMTAENAIKLLDGGSFAEAIVATATEASTVQTVASTGEKRPRGRPRKTEASVAVHVPLEAQQPTEYDEMDVYHSDTFNVEERAFPMFPDEWFVKNIEEARKYCRDLLSARLSEIGPDATRKEIADNTQMARVSDFDAQACMKYYRAITRAIVDV